MKPMLLQEYPCHKDTVNAEDYIYIQPKLDGWRAIVNTKSGIIYSRSGRVLDLPHITKDILNMNIHTEWLDGELYYHGGNCDTVNSLVAQRSTKLKFYCFDVITDGAYSDRLKAVNAIKETEYIRIVSTAKIRPCEIDHYYNQYLGMKLEGAVIRLDREYVHGRSEKILKLKPRYL